MDYLPLPHNASEHLEIPDLGGEEYDGEEFLDYPARCGWDISKLRQGNVQESKLSGDHNALELQAAQFLQTWVFFGTLSELLGRVLKREEYSVVCQTPSENERRCLTGRKLLPLLSEWASGQRSVPKQELAEKQQKLESCLNLAALVLRDLSEHWKGSGILILPDSVHLHLVSHLYMLNYYNYLSSPLARYATFADAGRHPAFVSRLVKEGWCPNLIERLVRAIGVGGLYYTTLMGRASETVDHVPCSPNACIANNIEMEHYHTRHVDVDCCCDQRGAPDSDLLPILRGQDYPIFFVRGDDDSLVLEVKAFDGVQSYIAISHVWSDGLGNPHANSLPKCQLRMLRQRVAELEDSEDIRSSQCLWLDTICVPVNSESARGAAILAMRRTYSEARVVLVLDRGLLSVDVPTSHEETLVRIFRSNWMTRLWTLQEAAVAPNLYFQFANQAVDFRDLRRIVTSEPVYSWAGFLGHRTSVQLQGVFGITSPARSRNYKYPLAAVWTALRWRNTTRASDAAICVANLIGSDVSKVLDTVNEEKMEAFWSSQSEIPSSILWVNGPRLKSSAFRWAPSSLLNVETLRGGLRDKCTPAKQTVAGLEIHGYPAYWIRYPWVPKNDNDSFKLYIPDNDQTYYIHKVGDVGNVSWVDVGIHWLRKCALIMQDTPRRDGWIPGVLVAEYAEFAGVIRTQWLAQVSVFEEGGTYDVVRDRGVVDSYRSQRLYTPKVFQEARDAETGIVREAWGEGVGLEQKWLIS